MDKSGGARTGGRLEGVEADGNYTARLLTTCADGPGIVAAVSGFLFARGANIVSSHQYSSDPTGGRFFLRTEFVLADGADARAQRQDLQESFAREVADRFGMQWQMRWRDQRLRMAILASRQDHCLLDLIWRWQRGELDAEIAMVISNHPDLEARVTAAGLPYHHVPVDAGEKARAEEAMLALLGGRIDLLVLARYMQILSGDFLRALGVPAINIHHSFLPAFAGAEPYRQAREHGVKLIGATSHYVTEELDAGPIIEQDVVRVGHQHTARELERMGRDVERVVLARAVTLHLDDRVIVDGPRTIVFGG
ncbi:MAG TPA: formyltetrahydrofolate deformylase [Solirubrobacteraceae bacterium]|nr:formyltetrahydrofolate deformylase [Solirubrobacteraceae bacterium]